MANKKNYSKKKYSKKKYSKKKYSKKNYSKKKYNKKKDSKTKNKTKNRYKRDKKNKKRIKAGNKAKKFMKKGVAGGLAAGLILGGTAMALSPETQDLGADDSGTIRYEEKSIDDTHGGPEILDDIMMNSKDQGTFMAEVPRETDLYPEGRKIEVPVTGTSAWENITEDHYLREKVGDDMNEDEYNRWLQQYTSSEEYGEPTGHGTWMSDGEGQYFPKFEELDGNGDGKISPEDFNNFNQSLLHRFAWDCGENPDNPSPNLSEDTCNRILLDQWPCPSDGCHTRIEFDDPSKLDVKAIHDIYKAEQTERLDCGSDEWKSCIGGESIPLDSNGDDEVSHDEMVARYYGDNNGYGSGGTSRTSDADIEYYKSLDDKWHTNIEGPCGIGSSGREQFKQGTPEWDRLIHDDYAGVSEGVWLATGGRCHD